MRRALLLAPVVLEAWVGASTAYLLGSVALAARRSAPVPKPLPGDPLRTVVLVPAHNEEAGLARTLAGLLDQDFPDARHEIVVIADNCSDRTAAVARAAGVTTWERVDAGRGKGQALSWALERVWSERPDTDTVVVIDADCRAARDLLSSLDAALRGGAMAAQVVYDVANPDASAAAALRWAAFALKHRVRPQGRAALGLSAGLFGTGMAFRSSLLHQHPWRSFSVSEDLEYHVELAEAGVRVAFVANTRVESDMPTTAAGARTQQLRWESGNARFARRGVPLTVAGVRRRDANLVVTGLELLLPPQSLLGPANALGLAAATLLRSRGLAVAAVASTLGQALYVLAGLRVAGAPPAVYRALTAAPSLIAGKLPVFGRIAQGRAATEWHRTEREPLSTRPVEVV